MGMKMHIIDTANKNIILYEAILTCSSFDFMARNVG